MRDAELRRSAIALAPGSGISAEESVDTEYRPGITECILNWAGGGGGEVLGANLQVN